MPRRSYEYFAGREHKKQRKYIDALFTASRVSKLTPMFYQVTRKVRP